LLILTEQSSSFHGGKIMGMLNLGRKRNEKIMIGDDIVILVTNIKGGQVQLGITAPGYQVDREEVRLQKEKDAEGK
jgi:carbon storage regulator